MILSKTYTFTKRSLGWLLLLVGIVGFLGIVAIDLLDVGRQGGIGPAQRVGLGLCIALAALGLTLLPLGSAKA